MPIGQKGFAQYLLILILLAGIGVSVYLTQFTQIFKPKASETSQQPIGYLDVANDKIIAGWTLDPDNNNPLYVHIYVDGVLYQDIRADDNRADVGAHGFHFNPPSFGSGSHEVNVFAIDIDSKGALAGNNFNLTGSPKNFTGNCDNFIPGADEQSWCFISRDQHLGYWENRQKDTKLMWNEYVKLGFNTSYGGMITQLYSNDRSHNLITEHPGASVQLSIWGFENNGGGGVWSGPADVPGAGCDPTPYPAPDYGQNPSPISDTAKVACEAVNGQCSINPSIGGAQTSDCRTVTTCNNFPSAGPWNPIQASGENCLWDTPTNDVTATQPTPGVWEIKKTNPYQYTKSDAFNGMEWTQQVSLGDVYAKLNYKIHYNGPFTTLNFQPQEIPAIYAAGDINKKFYYYEGDAAFTDPHSTVKQISLSADDLKDTTGKHTHFLGLPNRNPQLYLHSGGQPPFGIVNEYWWGACNADETQCVTVATFSPLVYEAGLQPSPPYNRGAYLTPLGIFQLKPEFNEELNVYMFPYKYDKVINGKSVRERIYELARAELPEFASPSPSPSPAKKIGDLEPAGGDGDVDLADFNAFVSDFQSKNLRSDFNKNGRMDIFDFNLLVQNFGE